MILLISPLLLISLYLSSLFFPSRIFLLRLFSLSISLLFLFSFFSLQHSLFFSFLDGLFLFNLRSLLSFLFLFFFLFLFLVNYTSSSSSSSYSFLLLFSNLFSSLLLISSQSWLISFFSLELFNFSLYLFISLPSSSSHSLPNSIKYFLLSSFTSSLFLLGIFFLYLHSGSLLYFPLSLFSDSFFGPFFLLSALLFKFSLFPFHSWAPDLYSSLSNLNCLWFIIFPKFTFFFFFLNILFLFHLPFFSYFISFSAFFSLLLSSFAFFSNLSLLRRFFAYSSILNFSFILLASPNISIMIFYFLVYSLISFLLFSILHSLNLNYFSELSCLIHNPFLALSFTISILSLAGILFDFIY